jgi:hypothetical protein
MTVYMLVQAQAGDFRLAHNTLTARCIDCCRRWTGRLQRHAPGQAQVPHHWAEDPSARACVELGGGQRQPHGSGIKVGTALGVLFGGGWLFDDKHQIRHAARINEPQRWVEVDMAWLFSSLLQ